MHDYESEYLRSLSSLKERPIRVQKRKRKAPGGFDVAIWYAVIAMIAAFCIAFLADLPATYEGQAPIRELLILAFTVIMSYGLYRSSKDY